MATQKCVRRLNNEMRKIEKEPIPNAFVRADNDNVLDWYFVIHGLDGDYTGGMYLGKISFPLQEGYFEPIFSSRLGSHKPGWSSTNYDYIVFLRHSYLPS